MQPGLEDLLEQFDKLYGRAPIAALLVDSNGLLLASNNAFGALTGRNGADLQDQQIWEWAGNTDRAEFHRARAEAVQGKPGHGVLRCKLPAINGHPHWFDLHFMKLSTECGADDYLIAHCRDCGPDASSSEAAETKPSDHQRPLQPIEQGKTIAWSLCLSTGKMSVSDTWYRLMGYAPDDMDLSGESFLELVHQDDLSTVRQVFDDFKALNIEETQMEIRVRDAGGLWRSFGFLGAIVKHAPTEAASTVSGTFVDIGWRQTGKTSEPMPDEAKDEHRTRLDHLAETSPVGLFEFLQYPDGTVTFPYVTKGVLDTLGVSRADVDADGSSCFKNIVPEYLDMLQAAIAESRDNLSHFRVRYQVRHPEKGLVWAKVNSVPSRLPDGSTIWHGSLYDITPEVEREAELQKARDKALRMQKKMEKLALHDVLTDLPNRRYFDARLKEQRERALACRKDSNVTLIRVDLDHFKYINDNLGHDAGDAVLIHVAKLLRKGIRRTDFAARIGGDEFSIILGENASTEVARQIVARVQNALDEPFIYGDQTCRCGASFGIATCEAREVNEGELHAFADAALYEAKQKGRNRVEIFTRKLHNHILGSRRLATQIEDALHRSEFEPVFQPQVRASDGVLVGLETLARWHHPERGLISPDLFMNVAEQIRVVPLIDQMMLEKTRDILAWWRKEGFVPPKISFNVSSGRLRDPEILNAARLIRSEGTVVAFELLESILVEDENDEFRFNLDALKDSGIQIEIDDFGSGHASIIGVMEAEPSVLKIDKRLTDNVAENVQARELISAIVRISGALGLSTTIEGVETKEQADILADLGCDVLQGYYFAQPLTAEQVLEYAAQHRADSA